MANYRLRVFSYRPGHKIRICDIQAQAESEEQARRNLIADYLSRGRVVQKIVSVPLTASSDQE